MLCWSTERAAYLPLSSCENSRSNSSHFCYETTYSIFDAAIRIHIKTDAANNTHQNDEHDYAKNHHSRIFRLCLACGLRQYGCCWLNLSSWSFLSEENILDWCLRLAGRVVTCGGGICTRLGQAKLRARMSILLLGKSCRLSDFCGRGLASGGL